jgi:hypothetical protein
MKGKDKKNQNETTHFDVSFYNLTKEKGQHIIW